MIYIRPFHKISSLPKSKLCPAKCFGTLCMLLRSHPATQMLHMFLRRARTRTGLPLVILVGLLKERQKVENTYKNSSCCRNIYKNSNSFILVLSYTKTCTFYRKISDPKKQCKKNEKYILRFLFYIFIPSESLSSYIKYFFIIDTNTYQNNQVSKNKFSHIKSSQTMFFSLVSEKPIDCLQYFSTSNTSSTNRRLATSNYPIDIFTMRNQIHQVRTNVRKE